MTYDDFLTALAATGYAWRLDDMGRIRADGPHGRDVCPITALRGERVSKFDLVAAEVGLDTETAQHIACAADQLSRAIRKPVERQIRSDLLDVCGLQEPRP